MAEVQSAVSINDIPEELRPFRNTLLKAAFGQVFTPEYLASQMPEATFFNPQAQYQQPQQPQTPAPIDYSMYLPVSQPETILDVIGLGRGSLGESARSIENGITRGSGRAYASGGLAQAAEEIERALAGSDVTLSPGGTPLGGYYVPVDVSPSPLLPGYISSGTRPPPKPVPPAVTPPSTAGPGGIINTPPSGTLPIGQPPQTLPQPGGSSLGVASSLFTTQKPANFAGSAQAQAMGYNPAQYADDTVAAQLAKQMGGTQLYTNTAGGPIAPPSQAMLGFGGTDAHNAGLIDSINTRFADDPGMKALALQNLRDEIKSYGGTVNFAKGGLAKLAEGGFPNPLGVGTANPSTQPTPAGMQSGVINPYKPYQQQRVLDMGNFGQVGAGGTLQASDLTRNSLAGYGNIPSYYKNGEIFADRDTEGRATTPLGIANDIFDTTGNLAVSAAQRAQYLSDKNPLSSTFQNTLAQIAQNPQMFQAGDISLGQLTAPQMESPLGVSGSQLTSYQMAGPSLIDTTGGRVSAGTVSTNRFIDPNNPQDYMSPYMREVIDVQKNRANQDYQEAKAGRDAQAIRAGAFGGSRQAVADSLAARDQQELLNKIEATGLQSAYENAQQQFERDRAANLGAQQFNVNTGLQAALANQGMGLQGQLANQSALQNANQANLNAALGVQELGANQALQAQLANQNAGLTGGQANLNAALQTQNLARTSGLQAAQANQATRLSQNTTLLDALARADQLQQQAAQGNFSNNLSAIGQQTQSALAGNTIGQNRADLARLAQALELQRLQSMGQAGSSIDTRTQGALDLGYQDWSNQQNYPYQQMNWLQSMLSGTPMGYNQEQVQFQKTNPLSQLTGLGIAGLGAYTGATR